MSVEDWAMREAEKRYDGPTMHVGTASDREKAAGQWGIVHAFSALLSDEAVEAAADRISDATEPGNWSMVARAALKAAITAVTEGDTE